MKLSQYFLPTLKESPISATAMSHQLMLRAGMIRQVAAGLYQWLPLGIKVLNKVEEIVREQLDAMGCQEIRIPTMQPIDLWVKSGRYQDGIEIKAQMLVARNKKGNDLIFSPSAEEAVTEMVKNDIQSYKALPLKLYQIENKFRDELRPRFGAMRLCEFLMKDAYSFDLTEEEAIKSYKAFGEVYLKILNTMGLHAIAVKADSGDMGGEFSHEFHIISQIGESTIFFDKNILQRIEGGNFTFDDIEKYYVAAEEKHDITMKSNDIVSSKAIEVGHIFIQGQKYTKALDFVIQDPNGKKVYPYAGAYGIGISRLVAAAIEANHDDKGIIWHKSISPFSIMIINLFPNNKESKQMADYTYKMLQDQGYDTLYDDTKNAVGYKLSNADLIGIPIQIIIGKTASIQIKNRATGEIKEVAHKDIIENITHIIS